MQFELKEITPAVAEALLQRNTINRPLNKNVVFRYARQMENGDWKSNGEAIRIGADGTLLDGQHRLAAIVKTGLSIPLLVVSGLEKDVICTIDTGKPRSIADHLEIFGVKGNAAILAAAIRVAQSFDTNGSYTRDWDKLPAIEAIAFLESNPGLVHSAERVSWGSQKMMPSGICIALHYVFSKVDAKKTEEFFAQLLSGVGLLDGSPVLALRNRMSATAGMKRNAAGRRAIIGYTVNAFKAFISGRSISQLKYFEDSEINLDFAKTEHRAA